MLLCCQKEIVKLIAERDADYIITLKKNQGQLYKHVEELFKSAIRTGFQGIEHSFYHTKERAHGREEIRHYLMLSNINEQIDPSHNQGKRILSIRLLQFQ